MMIRYLFTTTLLVLDLSVAIAQSFGMDNFLWKNRPLLVFAPSADAPAAQELGIAVTKAQEDFGDRDMVLIEVYQDDAALLDGKRLPGGTARALRDHYGVAEGETRVILVGKDGSEKLRNSVVTDLEPIFRLIDSMPMRRLVMQ